MSPLALPCMDNAGIWEYEFSERVPGAVDRIDAALNDHYARLGGPAKHLVLGRDVYESLCLYMARFTVLMAGQAAMALLTEYRSVPIVVVDVPGHVQTVMAPPEEFGCRLRRPEPVA